MDETGSPKFEPLLYFSLYTAVQVDILKSIARELTQISDKWGAPNGQARVIENIQRYYGLFWLWTLGAYEVVRTMDANSEKCFGEDARKRIKVVKGKLAEIRMPFAKQQLRSSVIPLNSENSFVNVTNGLCFEIKGEILNSADIIRDTIELFSSITRQDVVSSIPRRNSH